MTDAPEQKKTERLHLLISPAELDAIDDWRFKNRLNTRAEAVRRLVQIGLAFDAAMPELDEHMAQLAEEVQQVMKAFEAWEADVTGEIDADVVFVSVAGAMGGAIKILRDLAEVGERRKAWLVNDDMDHVVKAAQRLEERIKIRRKGSDPLKGTNK